jgi:nucleoside 2-deoxyribosyltransferase
MLLAFLPRLSLGTIWEMGWACAYRTPIICVTENPDIKNHPFVLYHAGWVLPDLKMAVDTINMVLAPYVEDHSLKDELVYIPADIEEMM